MIIDRATELESNGSFQDAIERYNSAIKLLTQAGWSESQLQNLKMKVAALSDKDEIAAVPTVLIAKALPNTEAARATAAETANTAAVGEL